MGIYNNQRVSLSFLSSTIIEVSILIKFFDAGEALGHRRRDLLSQFLLCLNSYVMISSLFKLFSFFSPFATPLRILNNQVIVALLFSTDGKGLGWEPTPSPSYLIPALLLTDSIAQNLFALNSQCSASSLANDHRMLPPILLSPVMIYASQISPLLSVSRRTLSSPWLAKGNLGFTLVGLALFFGQPCLRGPKPMRCVSTSRTFKPRSVIPLPLSSQNQALCCSLTSNGRGHHLWENPLPLFGLYSHHLQILVSSPSMALNSNRVMNSGFFLS